jgi:hypothetical protein
MKILRVTSKGLEGVIPININFYENKSLEYRQRGYGKSHFYAYIDSIITQDFFGVNNTFFTSTIDGICVFKKVSNMNKVDYNKTYRNNFHNNKVTYHYKVISINKDIKEKVLNTFTYLGLEEKNIKIMSTSVFLKGIEYKGIPVLNIEVKNAKTAKRALVANTL